MSWFIIGIILTIIIVGIMKDTHFKCYNGMKVVEEFDIRIPLWFLIIIILVEQIPFLNIILFLTFIIAYFIFSNMKPEMYLVKDIPSLKGETYVGKIVIKIKKLLCTEI